MDDYLDLDPDDIPNGIAEEMTDSDWQKKLCRLEKRTRRLQFYRKKS